MKMILAFLSLSIMGCAELRNYQLQPFYNEMNTQIGQMTYDQSLQRWGAPASVVQGDETFICTWSASASGAVALPLGQNVIYQPTSSGWKLAITFNKTTRKMTYWTYNEW
jgi:hypothetical protein